MSFNTHIYKPGDVLQRPMPHMEEKGSAIKDTNYVIIAYGYTNGYIVLKLSPGRIHPLAIPVSILEGDKTKKLGEVDLKQIPADLEELIDFAWEDDPLKWTNPPQLEYLKDCGVLKQYIL